MKRITFRFIFFGFLFSGFIFSADICAQVSQSWAAVYNNTLVNGIDAAVKTITDVQGNIYVTGYSDGGADNGNDIVTIKYNAAGSEQWVSRFNGSGSLDDIPSAITLDITGNVYVSGTTYTDTINGNDLVTIKYNSLTGAQMWVQTYNGSGNGDDGVNDIITDPLGNIYVTGYIFGGLSSENNIITIKYDIFGTEQWIRTYNNSDTIADDIGKIIKIDNAGNLYVVGISYGGISTKFDAVVIKYNQAGSQIWLNKYNNSTYNNDDFIYDAVLDNSANLCITGFTQTSALINKDILLVAYDSSGNRQWVQTYNNSTFNGDDRAYSITADSQNNFIITGKTTSANRDLITIKYTGAGIFTWAKVYNNSSVNGHDEGICVKADRQNNIYVTGYTFTAASSSNSDIVTIKYDASGSQKWFQQFSGASGDNDSPSWLQLDSMNNVIVTGSSRGNNSELDFITIKYSQSSGIHQISQSVPDKFFLKQNYPNPFNPSTVISYSLPLSGKVNLTVYDAAGKLAAVLVDNFQNAGLYNVDLNGNDLSGGVYFYMLEVGSFRETKKMILVK
jgi:hypothetical protein